MKFDFEYSTELNEQSNTENRKVFNIELGNSLCKFCGSFRNIFTFPLEKKFYKFIELYLNKPLRIFRQLQND